MNGIHEIGAVNLDEDICNGERSWSGKVGAIEGVEGKPFPENLMEDEGFPSKDSETISYSPNIAFQSWEFWGNNLEIEGLRTTVDTNTFFSKGPISFSPPPLPPDIKNSDHSVDGVIAGIREDLDDVKLKVFSVEGVRIREIVGEVISKVKLNKELGSAGEGVWLVLKDLSDDRRLRREM